MSCHAVAMHISPVGRSRSLGFFLDVTPVMCMCESCHVVYFTPVPFWHECFLAASRWVIRTVCATTSKVMQTSCEMQSCHFLAFLAHGLCFIPPCTRHPHPTILSLLADCQISSFGWHHLYRAPRAAPRAARCTPRPSHQAAPGPISTCLPSPQILTHPLFRIPSICLSPQELISNRCRNLPYCRSARS